MIKEILIMTKIDIYLKLMNYNFKIILQNKK